MLKGNKKQKILLLSMALVLLLGAGTVLAFIHTNTSPIENSFTPSHVSSDVVEVFDGKVKTDVAVQNTSDIDAYIRADIVVTWKKVTTDDSGNKVIETYGKKPIAGEDYTIVFDAEDKTLGQKGWTAAADGFYYYADSVAPQELTNVLIESCAEIPNRAPEGYFLSVEIIASAIQADGVGSATTGADGEKNRPAEIAWTNDKVIITVNDAADKLTVTNR